MWRIAPFSSTKFKFKNSVSGSGSTEFFFQNSVFGSGLTEFKFENSVSGSGSNEFQVENSVSGSGYQNINSFVPYEEVKYNPKSQFWNSDILFRHPPT